MAATRPALFAALQTLLKSGVSAVSNKVFLPWDALPELASAPMLMISGGKTDCDNGAVIGCSRYTMTVQIGAVKTGKFDYQATWDLLASVKAAVMGNHTLSGSVDSMAVTGADDELVTEGERILWPHLVVEITYTTPMGTL